MHLFVQEKKNILQIYGNRFSVKKKKCLTMPRLNPKFKMKTYYTDEIYFRTRSSYHGKVTAANPLPN